MHKMDFHEGVSCDCCLKTNFGGRRYKCLTCYDYDLCSTCYDAGTVTTRHLMNHPVQCILTKKDFELYYGGEALLNTERLQSLTCPLCGKVGHTEMTLKEHVVAEHADSMKEVICPICACLPGGDPNYMTDDFGSHLILEHRTDTHDLISFMDITSRNVHLMRRFPQFTNYVAGGRSATAARLRRAALENLDNWGAPLVSSTRESDIRDPLTDIISQLSGVRRSTSNTNNISPTNQMHQLELQLQLERHQMLQRQMELLPRTPHRHVPTRDLQMSRFDYLRNIPNQTHTANKPVEKPKPAANPTHVFLLDSIKLERKEPSEETKEQIRQFTEEVLIATMKLPLKSKK